MLSNITRRFYSATASNMAAKKLQVGWVSVSPRIAAIAATADETSMMLTASIVWPWIYGQAYGREFAKVSGKERSVIDLQQPHNGLWRQLEGPWRFAGVEFRRAGHQERCHFHNGMPIFSDTFVRRTD